MPKIFVEISWILSIDWVWNLSNILGIHGVNTHEILWWCARPGGCLEVARQLIDEGKARHVGFSTHGSTDLILDAIRTEVANGFDYVNLHWYYIFQDNWPAVQAATDRDMGTFIISPSDKGGMLYQPPQKLVDLCQPLHPLVFNCLFCLNRPEIHTLSLGAARPTDFDLQMSTLPLLDEATSILPPIVSRLQAALEEAVGRDVVNGYQEGLLAWEANPGYMNIRVMLWLRLLALAFDLVDYGKMRYGLLGNGNHWFPGLNAAHVQELDLTKALAGSPFREQIPLWLAHAHELLYDGHQKRLSES